MVLGEKLPRLRRTFPPTDEAPAGLTERELIERHSSDPQCVRCHERIDPFGFALEGFDAIGRTRSHDSTGQPIDTNATLPNGDMVEGLKRPAGLSRRKRRDDF